MRIETEIQIIKVERGKKLSLEDIPRNPSDILIDINGKIELIDRIITNRGEYIRTLCRDKKTKRIKEKDYRNNDYGLDYIEFSWINQGYSRYDEVNKKLEQMESQLGREIIG